MITDIFLPSVDDVCSLRLPCFLTNSETLINRINILKDTFIDAKLHFAIKSNYNPTIIKILKDNGLFGVDTVSINEVRYAKSIGFTANEIIYTGNNVDELEISDVINEGVLFNIGSFDELEIFANNSHNKSQKNSIGVRLNPLFGVGENDFVNTGGEEAKFGIRIDEIDKLNVIVKKYDLNIVCIHFHLGSGLYNASDLNRLFDVIESVISQFPRLQKIDLGGGFGVRYEMGLDCIKLHEFKSVFENRTRKINAIIGREIDFLFEPGKFLVTESTVLLAKITNIRQISNKYIIGINTGMNHNIRPPLYGAKHGIRNISSDLEKVECDVYGNICESADFLAKSVKISRPRIGDIVCILSSGGYCSSMSSFYNMRNFADEYLLSGDGIIKTRDGSKFSFKELGYV